MVLNPDMIGGRAGRFFVQQALELPSEANLGEDVTESIFALDVAQHLEQIEAVLANPSVEGVAEALRTQVEALACVGKLFDLPGFVEIAHTTLAALSVSPQATLAIGQLALEDFRAGREAVLQGDRIQGGVPSPAWAEFAARSQVDTLDPTAIALANLCAPSPPPPIPAPELRLATTQLFICLVDDLAFITLPFNNIAEILTSQAELVKQAGKRFLYWQERMVRVYRLSDLLDYTRPLPKATATSNGEVLTMLVFSQNNHCCALELKIDRLVTEPELIVKPFGAAILPPRYLYGCTIVEGGRLMPVIDGTALLNQAKQSSARLT